MLKDPLSFEASAQILMERCATLACYSEVPTCLTRRFATQAMSDANTLVISWMMAAGMEIVFDNVGNLIGRYEGSHLHAKTLLLGSHLDTVINAGKYDGVFGVLTALACVERLHTNNLRLPFAIEITAFADEEGLRYNYAYIGSKAAVGTFEANALLLTDTNGITMAEAIRAFGGNPDLSALQTARWQREDLLGYCEVHIEQGPVLEKHNLPIAVVSSIAGQSRLLLHFTGEAGHAGTVPMSLRHDALCAAAEFILAVEEFASTCSDLVATVGKVSVQPGAANVIPGFVSLSLDVRHQTDTIRQAACQQLWTQASMISQHRQVKVEWQEIQENCTIPCTPRLTALLEQAITQLSYPAFSLSSGAGHDAVAMSVLTDVAMLFVRCRGGISHHPDESITMQDAAIAIAVLERFLSLL